MSFYCDLKERYAVSPILTLNSYTYCWIPLSVSPEFAPALKRGLILLAAKHEFGLTGRRVWCDGHAYLHHKSQILRTIGQEFAEAPDSPGDWSILAIFILVSLEVSISCFAPVGLSS